MCLCPLSTKVYRTTNPLVALPQLAKKILDYAKFDRIAMKVEAKFKQAGLVRAKTAIMMMNRTINSLRQQMVRMIFVAWKGHNAIASQHEAIMQRLITIKDIQIKSNRKELAFAMWKGYVSRMIEEREQRFAIAARRSEPKTSLLAPLGCMRCRKSHTDR